LDLTAHVEEIFDIAYPSTVVAFFKNLFVSCTQVNASEEEKLIGTAVKPFSHFEVIGRVDESGLGLLSWWQAQADDEEGA
jgi:hypothetical protein